jgi:hypothetical protein
MLILLNIFVAGSKIALEYIHLILEKLEWQKFHLKLVEHIQNIKFEWLNQYICSNQIKFT